MAVVTGSAEAWAERNKEQAGQLLKIFAKAKTSAEVPTIGTALLSGGDHPRPQGLFASALFPPFVWPEDSETALHGRAEAESERQRMREGQADDVHSARNAVFTQGVWQGEGADAADAAYAKLEQKLNESAAASRLAKRLIGQAASDVERTKRLMSQANKAMHDEIEKYLRSGSGQSLAQIAVITGRYRAIVQSHMADLHTYATQYTTRMLGNFPLTPEGGKAKPANGTTEESTDPAPEIPPKGDDAVGIRGHSGASSGPPETNGISGPPHTRQSTDGSGAPLQSGPGRGLPSPLGSGSGLPMSGVPSMPGAGGGGGSPISGLQGLLSGIGFNPGTSMSPAALGSSPLPAASPSSAGVEFGRGLAAGASAAGGAVSAPMGPLPQSLSGPLAAPAESAPSIAAPAAAASTTTPPSASASASAGIGMPAGLTPYGSVLPPAGPAAAPPPASVPGVPPVPAEGGAAAASPSAGLVPAVSGRAVSGVSREDAASDVEVAKMAVAELAGASCVVDAGLDWAVAVGHNGSGSTTLWVATNDGACYIPPGVFLRNGMAVAGGFDEDFDARWMGWTNPAEKAVRSARANGDRVGAVATTWAWPSEFLEDPDEGVRQVAIGVPHGGPDGPASELRRTRMHRLQTVNAGLYASLKAMDEPEAIAYCREMTRRAVSAGVVELSPLARVVADALVAGGWPKAEEWAALHAEYESDRLMMAAQRPGLNGLEDPEQVVSYQNFFSSCRRLEILLCWKRSDALMAADVAYAGWTAGYQLALSH